MTKRSDIHRESALVCADYEYVLSYNGATQQDGWPVPSFRVNCELDRRAEVDGKIINGKHDPDGRCCVIGLLHIAKVRFAERGGTCQCTACGTHFVYGDVWRHKPTGEHIHLGHICANKVGLHAERSEYKLAEGRHRAAALTRLKREHKEEQKADFLAAHPGLEQALGRDHYILNDMSYKLYQYGGLSEKQVELAYKIARDVDEHEKSKGVSQHIGETGKRLEADVTIQHVASWESDWGTQYLYVMVDGSGNKLTWKTSSYPDFYRGDRCRIKGTVKDHGEYRGEKQTVLTRVCMVEMYEKKAA